MDSDSDSPFNYSWPSFPKMRMRRKTGKKGNIEWDSDGLLTYSFIDSFSFSIMSNQQLFLVCELLTRSLLISHIFK